MKPTLALIVPGALIAAASPAYAQSVRTTLSVSIDGSAASNPFLLPDGDAAGSATISIDPAVFIEDERGDVAVRSNLRYSQYTSRYGGDEAGRLAANARYALDERTRATASAYVSSSRTPLRDNLAFGLGNLLEPDGIENFEVPFLDPTISGGFARVTRFGADAGIGYTLNPTSSINAGLSASMTEFDGVGIDYRDVSGRVGYSRRLSERTTVGANFQLAHVDYRGGQGGSTIATPSVDLQLQLSETMTLSGDVGFSYVDSDRAGSSQNSFVFAGNVQLCNRGLRSALCLGASNSARPTAFGDISRVTSLAANYDLRLSEVDRFSVGARYTRTGSEIGDDQITVTNDDGMSFGLAGWRELYGIDARYNRELTDRVSVFISPSFLTISDDVEDREPNYELRAGVTIRFGAQ